MTGLALRSLRHRMTASTATFVAVLLGAVVMGSFAPLVQLALGADVSSEDRSTLLIMGAVVGGWGFIIVLFSVASTVGITVGQREVEVGLLRTIGAVPRQVRRLVRAETLVVVLVAALLGDWVANLTSRALFLSLQRAGMVSDGLDYTDCWAALGVTAVVLVAAGLAAASIAGRRATRGPASVVPTEARPGSARVRWWRIVLAVVLVGHAVSMGILTVLGSTGSDPYDAMSTAGSLGLVVGVAQALVGPVLLAWGSRLLRPFLGGAAGHLAAYNTSRRAQLLGGVLAPVVILTAASVSILMLVGTDHRTLPAGYGEDSRAINLLNNVVTGMICTFAAIMVVNSFAAVVTHRRAELVRLSLLGATRRQIEGSVVAEAAVVAAVGVLLGLVASLFTIVPFGLARHEGVVPNGQLWLPPVLAVAVVVLTLASARGAVHRVSRQALGATR